MKADEIYEAQKRLIESENVNVSETNVLKDFAQIVLKILLILVSVYVFFMLISGIVINFLTVEQQIKFENLMTRFIGMKAEKISKADKINLNKTKNKILNIDKNYPKTSNLDIRIHKNDDKNAFCLPNGNIYITSSLYEKIKDDEQMLTFIIAHEMAHYKNKDHIMGFRKNIASVAVMLLIALSTSDEKVSSLIADTINLSDLSHSRGVEAKADNYAGKILLKEFGTVKGGVDVLTLLSDKKYPKTLYIFSTHPSVEKRIEYLNNIN